MTTETSAQDQARQIWEAADAADAAGTPLRAEAQPQEEQQTEQSVSAAPERRAPESAEASNELDDPKLLRDKIAGLEAVIQQFGGRLRNAEGHIGGLNSQLKQRVQAAQQVNAAGGDAPSAREIAAAQNDPQALSDLEREYPEFAKVLKGPMETMRTQLAELQQKTSQPNESPDFKRELAALRSEMQVESRHPGWLETVAKPEFNGWLQQAPREQQMLAASDRPEDAIRLLDLYSAARNSGSKSNQRLQAAAALPTGQRVTARTKNVDDMTPQEYWRYLDEIDKQKT